jgi:hypothetical protein
VQPQWGQQQGQPAWPPQQPQWGQQSQPSWPAQQQQPQSAWEPTQQQWGQPPHPQQQWGQPQSPVQQLWEQQLTLQPAKKSKKGLIIAGAVAVIVIIIGAVVGAIVLLSGDKLDSKAVQDGVQKVLKDSYGIDDVQDVSCPSKEKVEVGNTFDCNLKIGGEQKKVTVKVTKSDGTYEVGRPN